MPLWGLTDAVSNVVKTVAMGFDAGVGNANQLANNNAMYGNVSSQAFGSPVQNTVIGIFGVSAAEMANTGGERKKVTSAGWNVRKAGLGPVTSFSITAPGQNYANTNLIKVSGGQVNASGTIVTNGSGNITSVAVTSGGAGFINVSASTISITNATGGATGVGTGATLTFALGGRAGRVTYECMVATRSMSNGASDDTYLPQ